MYVCITSVSGNILQELFYHTTPNKPSLDLTPSSPNEGGSLIHSTGLWKGSLGLLTQVQNEASRHNSNHVSTFAEYKTLAIV